MFGQFRSKVKTGQKVSRFHSRLTGSTPPPKNVFCLSKKLLCFNSVRDVTIEHTNSADARVEGDANGALGVVGRGRDLSGAPRPVTIAVDQVVPGTSKNVDQLDRSTLSKIMIHDLMK